MDVSIDRFNSEIFQIQMGNITNVSPNIGADELKLLIEESSKQGYNHLNVKLPVQYKETGNVFFNQGFVLVDTQVMYKIPVDKLGELQSTDLFSYREFRKNDLEQIISIANTAYVLDQYHSDLTLDDSLCDKYYSVWVNNCCNGLADKVMVAENNAKNVCGYITLNYSDKSATVGLSAVDERCRGKGIFTSLMAYTLQMLRQEGIECLYYGTQISNTPVLRTMGKFCGFIEYSNHVLHLMISST